MKKIFTVLVAIMLTIIPFSGCKNNDNKLRLCEVTHSVFYAPLYIAIENNYFLDEGLEIELSNGGGADNCMTALISGSADIGLMGPETVIYIYNQNKKDLPKVFAQLTQTDGSFLVSRSNEQFNWSNLVGKEILAGRRGGVPAMTFEYIMNEMGYENGKDYTLNFNVQFNLMTSAFIGGTADYCTVFEPTASEYQTNKTWYIVASIGEKAGEIPYTSFISLSSYLEKNRKKIEKFIKALKKAETFLQNNTDLVVAQSIVKQFPSTTINSIETSIKNYRKINAWKYDLLPTENSFTRLQDIMIYAKELSSYVPYNSIINDNFVK